MKTPYHSKGFIAALSALRPRQWTKNLIVFAAPLFAFQLNLVSFFGSLLAFILFCCVSSGFYLVNDIADAKADRQHPVKRYRAIASGRLSIPVAIFMAVSLLLVALSVSWWLNWQFGLAITSYALLQSAYNWKFKHMVILDVFAISTGFVLRAFAGASSTHIALSYWFLICTAMLSLFLAIEKRKAELRFMEQGTTRVVLNLYSIDLLHRMENVVTAGTIITYTLWSAGPQLQGASTPWMLLTVPFVLYGVFRYQWLADSQSSTKLSTTERPEEVLLSDAALRITLISWIIAVFFILLLERLI